MDILSSARPDRTSARVARCTGFSVTIDRDCRASHLFFTPGRSVGRSDGVDEVDGDDDDGRWPASSRPRCRDVIIFYRGKCVRPVRGGQVL